MLRQVFIIQPGAFSQTGLAASPWKVISQQSGLACSDIDAQHCGIRRCISASLASWAFCFNQHA
jgi:hypothetical protein